jgi:alpha-1,6-mannosyltransferase
MKANALVVAGAGVGAALGYVVLVWASQLLHPLPLGWFFGVLAVVTAEWMMTWAYLRRREASLAVIGICFAAAILFRVIGYTSAPLYEDDFYRYLWDGYVFATHGNPYGVPPAAFFGAENLPPVLDGILTRVNYPDIPTLYGPVCELSFLLGYAIAPGQIWPLKLLFLAADLAIVFFLWRTTQSAAAVVLYAWAPLVIKEVAFTAHPDVLAALLAVLAVWQSRKGRMIAAGALLGAAVAAKVIVIVLLPFVLPRRNWRAATAFAATVFAFYMPFLLRGTSDLAGLAIFAAEWEFNSFAYAVLKAIFGSSTARLLSPALFMLAAAAIWKWRREWFRPDVLLILMFTFAPVVNPWYLLLLAPFVAMEPSWWGVAALAIIMLSYATGLNLERDDIGKFDHPGWVRPTQAAVVLIAAVCSHYCSPARYNRAQGGAP